MNLKKIIRKNRWGDMVSNKRFSELTTMKVGGKIKYLFYPNSLNSLMEAVKFFEANRLPYFILGNGSNIIASDKPYKDIVIHCKYMKQNLSFEKERITVSACYDLRRFNGFLVSRNIESILFLAGVPGTVGGAVYMNAGANGDEISSSIISVTYLENGILHTKKREEIKFGYRYSEFQERKAIIVEVCFQKKEGKNVYKRYRELVENRKGTQPLTFPNSGSIFRNLQNQRAYEVIQKIDLKGFEINGAKFSDLHANFIINRANARGKDVYQLIQLAIKLAKELENVELIPEVRLINFK